MGGSQGGISLHNTHQNFQVSSFKIPFPQILLPHLLFVSPTPHFSLLLSSTSSSSLLPPLCSLSPSRGIQPALTCATWLCQGPSSWLSQQRSLSLEARERTTITILYGLNNFFLSLFSWQYQTGLCFSDKSSQGVYTQVLYTFLARSSEWP